MTLTQLERCSAGARPRGATCGPFAPSGSALGGDGPTPEQRRALRRELASGLGLRGRMRAWWALPPSPCAAVDASYTG